MTDTDRQTVAAAAQAIHSLTCRAAELPASCDGATSRDFELARAAVDAAGPLLLAAERERGEALVVQAQDYASAESDRAGKLAALALKIFNQCCALHPTGDAGYLDEWSMALDQLDGAAGEMSPPDSDPLEEANQAGIRWERERIISLASTMRAAFPAGHPKSAQASFADYLRVTSADLVDGDGNG